MSSMTEKDEETRVLGLLARAFYLDYCKAREFVPRREPYVPEWAIDYAQTAIQILGYDDEALEELRKVGS